MTICFVILKALFALSLDILCVTLFYIIASKCTLFLKSSHFVNVLFIYRIRSSYHRSRGVGMVGGVMVWSVSTQVSKPAHAGNCTINTFFVPGGALIFIFLKIILIHHSTIVLEGGSVVLVNL